MFDDQSSSMPPTRAVVRNAASSSTPPKQVKSGALFEGAQEVRIDHNGQEYRLRQTRHGKLILTK